MNGRRLMYVGWMAAFGALNACDGRVAAPPAIGFVAPVADAGLPPPVTVAVPRRAADGSFPAQLTWSGRELLRNGSGLCEWGIFGVDLYVAALYCERRVDSCAAALDPAQTVVVHLQFVRALSAEQLVAAFSASAEVNAGAAHAQFGPALERLGAAMRPVRSGDTLTFGCEPGRGVAVVRGGELVDRIEDEAFRRLFVQMYLGEHPPTAALRDGLLGR